MLTGAASVQRERVGYWLRSSHCGRGYMTEAVRALILDGHLEDLIGGLAPPRICALPAFWTGLLYDDAALDAAWIRARIDSDGTYTLTNSRNGYSKTYQVK